MTVAQALRAAATTLESVSESPRLDAYVLLAYVLGWTRGLLFAAGNDALSENQQTRLQTLIERRAAGEPIAYLTGEKEFWSLPLRVNADVLVPRPETELLVEWALEIINGRRETGDGRRRKSAPAIFDLGTGSGAIALALATELPEARIVATDCSAAALKMAADNAQRLCVTNVEFLAGSWFGAFPSPVSRLPSPDLIVSNPPYVAENDARLAALRHEPLMALAAGPDGLRDLREIIRAAPAYLERGGWLLLEHGAEQGGAVRELLRESGFDRVETRRDLAGCERASGGQIKVSF